MPEILTLGIGNITSYIKLCLAKLLIVKLSYVAKFLLMGIENRVLSSNSLKHTESACFFDREHYLRYLYCLAYSVKHTAFCLVYLLRAITFLSFFLQFFFAIYANGVWLVKSQTDRDCMFWQKTSLSFYWFPFISDLQIHWRYDRDHLTCYLYLFFLFW